MSSPRFDLGTLPAEAEITRALLARINSAAQASEVDDEVVIGELINAVVALERRLMQLEQRDRV